ncbi:hypothetical protein CTM53_08425 [Prevotella intermedia]|uniref:Uncharacterized protein n=1 Tax=Prevotella intermedia TaxID=28131 RepID=A0AAJ3VEP0_PREIN|nr:hypothetical protein CTM61_01285 [Prevotella intermedia]PJI20832.1 hypothetical protein CTM53_08425 [Prevotella intermedia]
MFCIPKAAVLRCKTYAFTVQNSHFRNVKSKLSVFKEIIFTKLSHSYYFATGFSSYNQGEDFPPFH